MTEPSPPASRLPESLRPGLTGYAQQLESLADSQLISLTVFGAVLTLDWRQGRPIHHALVLASDDLPLISRLHVVSPAAVKLGLAAPLVLTPSLLASTLDTFPLEWLEITTCHEVVTGTDVFQGLAFAHEHVRLQCERECVVLAMALRQRLLRGPRSVALPLEDLADQAVRILRGLLYLDGHALPAAPSELVAKAGQVFGIAFAPLVGALAGKSGVDIVTGLHGNLVELEKRSDHA